jgi:DNA-binding transcriptional MerR regulator
LPPALVDPVTGYWRYRVEQVRHARLICALRRIDVPIETLCAVLQDPDGPALPAALTQHRQRLLKRAETLNTMVRTVEHYIKRGVATSELKSPRLVQITINVRDLAKAVRFYKQAFDASFVEEISSFQFAPGRATTSSC